MRSSPGRVLVYCCASNCCARAFATSSVLNGVVLGARRTIIAGQEGDDQRGDLPAQHCSDLPFGSEVSADGSELKASAVGEGAVGEGADGQAAHDDERQTQPRGQLGGRGQLGSSHLGGIQRVDGGLVHGGGGGGGEVARFHFGGVVSVVGAQDGRDTRRHRGWSAVRDEKSGGGCDGDGDGDARVWVASSCEDAMPAKLCGW